MADELAFRKEKKKSLCELNLSNVRDEMNESSAHSHWRKKFTQRLACIA